MGKEFFKALDSLLNHSEIIIDRPKGTRHPRYTDIIYQVDYGYLKDTSSEEGNKLPQMEKILI